MNISLPKTILTVLCMVIVFMSPVHADMKKAEKVYEAEDYEKAFKDLLPEAEKGNARAQFILGLLYKQGRGIPQDFKQAAKWFLKAAEQGNARGQFSLGLLYLKGQGVSKDYKQAEEWLRKAAEQGNDKARELLEELEKLEIFKNK